MASIIGEEPLGSAMVETSPSMAIEAKLTLASGHADCQKLKDLLNKDDAVTMAMDAKLMASTGHDECQKLKNLLNKKEATVMVAATVSHKKNQASAAKPSLTRCQLRFLAAVSGGDLESLIPLLSRTRDIEEGTNVPAPSASAASLLESVTMEGDTALHLLAASGADGNNKKNESCAEFIHEKDNDRSLLYKKNNKGETALHCAAKAGKLQLVSRLIGLAKDDGKVQDLLRIENNDNETALHEAVRRGDKQMVKQLLRADPELASFPRKGTSPLYLAILLIDERDILLRKEDRQEEGSDDLLENNKEKSMAQTLHDESKHGFLSYLGPNGQNALHAAVLRSPGLVRKLLRWNRELTIQTDENGSTPLHFAAGDRQNWKSSINLHAGLVRKLLRWNSELTIQTDENGCTLHFAAGGWQDSKLVLEGNPEALYQLDKYGLSPIHVAASVGNFEAVARFVSKCPGSAGLRDAKGRTFLHAAVEKNEQRKSWIVRLLPGTITQSQPAWIMNMQDNDGNTALHLAVQSGSLGMFCSVFANREVHLSIANAKGQTPLDVAEYKINLPTRLYNRQSSKVLILDALKAAGARRGISRRDRLLENYQEDTDGIKSEYESKELENVKDLTQTQSIGAVLIATVTFGAVFALPGGYRADDHTNGGTPTLAGRYAFDAFVTANALSFMFSAMAVICLVRGGSPGTSPNTRYLSLFGTFHLIDQSVLCFIATFFLGLFVVLSPVAPETGPLIISVLPLILLVARGEICLKWLWLLSSFQVRMGSVRTVHEYTWRVVAYIAFQLMPLVLIFAVPLIQIHLAKARRHTCGNADCPTKF